jgi:diaminohydroxyphosphoribosylaminopyrimidine deaminase/5-amino-6-(5-phosphoribosylamino)uracil reductase
LDPKLRTPPGARTLAIGGKVLILTRSADRQRRTALEAAGATVVRGSPSDDGELDLSDALAILARYELNEVHLECGALLAGAMLRANLVDELVVYMAPTVLGDEARGLFHLPGLRRMAERIDLELTEARTVGRDLRLTLRPAAPGSLGTEN